MKFEKIKEKINIIYGYSSNERKANLALEIYPHIVNIAKELKKHGIQETDFHSGNIGWNEDHSRLVLYDLGGYIDNTTGVKIKNKLKQISLTEESFITKFSDYQNKTE